MIHENFVCGGTNFSEGQRRSEKGYEFHSLSIQKKL